MVKPNNSYLIVGLGNPHPTYFYTYHNIGFLFIDFFAKRLNLKFNPGKGRYYYAKDEIIYLLKPTTYMNLSGEGILEFLDRETKILSENIIVVHDDLDMPKFSVKMKFGGSSGGHKGIESIIYNLETENFWRIKIGISKPNNIPPKEYVLSIIPHEELNRFSQLFEDMSLILQNIGMKDIKLIQQEINAIRKKYVVI